MKMTAGLRIWVAGTLAALATVCGQAQDLKTMRGIYEKNSEEIRDGFKPKFDGLQQQYQKALEALKAGAVKQGDLARAKAAMAEIDRFQKTKSLPASLDANEIPDIKALHSAYVTQYNRLEIDMTTQQGMLTTKYEQALERFEKEMTKAEKFDAATEVYDEREKAQVAIKGYAETLAALKGSAATSATAGFVTPKPAFAERKPTRKNDLYMLIDLSGGKDAAKYPITYLAEMPKDGWTDEYKTEKLVMRRIEPGTFMMGSHPGNNPGDKYDETQLKVSLTHAFFIGVFEVTQRQWERVTGVTPSQFNGFKDSAARPVEQVSYDDIRGASAGQGWPATAGVDEASFMGVLRAKTGLAALDLPTEAQWEYACRAGTDKPCNGDLDEVAWFKDNSGAATHPAGQKRPNVWGLYDMHGNVLEWCLDWRGAYTTGNATDPAGATSGSGRVFRGGNWSSNAFDCRSARRLHFRTNFRNNGIGFRVAWPLP